LLLFVYQKGIKENTSTWDGDFFFKKKTIIIMKFSLVVFSVATIFAHSVIAAPAPSAVPAPAGNATVAAPTASAVAQPEQVEPVKLETGQIDITKIDPEELETIYQELEEDALLEDMMQSGWPEAQAQMVLSLSDIVDSLTEVPEEDEENQELVSSLDNVRNNMRQLLSAAGLEFHSMDANGRALSRMTTTKKAYSPKTVVTVVHGLVNLMRTASKFTAMLGNPTFSQYGMMISSAVQMIENLLGSGKDLVSPELPIGAITPQ
jgi:hypothetical protein